jgi:hypothetical protein
MTPLEHPNIQCHALAKTSTLRPGGEQESGLDDAQAPGPQRSDFDLAAWRPDVWLTSKTETNDSFGMSVL